MKFGSHDGMIVFILRYPDAVMRQVADLSKGIGKDYKTKQKERLQRTFVKASDAANAKIRGEKRKLGLAVEVPLKSSSIKETAWESSMDAEITRPVLQTSLTDPSFTLETSETVTYAPAVTTHSSTIQSIKYLESLKKKGHYERFSAPSPPKITDIKNAGQNSMSQLQRLCASWDINSDDPLTSNLLLFHKSFLKTFSTFFNFLNCSAQFSQIEIYQDFSTEESSKMSICTLSVEVEGDIITLGSGKDRNEKMAREAAGKDALEKLLQRCYTFEIKKPATGSEKITLDKLDGSQKVLGDQIYYNVLEQGDRISDENVGARLMALMGWSGGALGSEGQGITEPVVASKVIGRRGLGLRNQSEESPTPEFHRRVDKVLDSMLLSLKRQPDGLIPDLIFSSELSSEQRKHIHVLIRNYYPQLKSVSYGKDEERYLVVQPNLNNVILFRKVCLQGGLTDKYQIHKPGTLTLEDISKTQDP